MRLPLRATLIVTVLLVSASPAFAQLDGVTKQLPSTSGALSPRPTSASSPSTTTFDTPQAPLPSSDGFTDAPTTSTSGTLEPPRAAAPLGLREFVVGYNGEPPRGLVELLGGKVVSVDETLKFAVVRANDLDVLSSLVGLHPDLVYVQRNGAAHLAGSQWDGSQWDGSQWDGSQWDGSQWDSSQWDSSQWDGSQWDSSQWDAAQWDGSTKDPLFGAEWHLGAIHATDAWRVTSAYHTLTICVVDSGVDGSHPDLAKNMRRLANGAYGYDFVNEDNEPQDEGGHGTHIAGIAAAVAGNGKGTAGVSQSYILAAKVLDANGVGTEANLAKAIRWCADNGAHIVEMALHIDQDNRAVKDAVGYAKSKGVLLVAASGNAGARCKSCVAFPAAYSDVLAVGASLPNATVAPFSNGGDDLDLVAPGWKIPGPLPGGAYAAGTGTSQASAVAAGAAALVWTAKPGFSPSDVASALKNGAKDGGTSDFDWTFGYGHLRLDRTLRNLGFVL